MRSEGPNSEARNLLQVRGMKERIPGFAWWLTKIGYFVAAVLLLNLGIYIRASHQLYIFIWLLLNIYRMSASDCYSQFSHLFVKWM